MVAVAAGRSVALGEVVAVLVEGSVGGNGEGTDVRTSGGSAGVGAAGPVPHAASSIKFANVRSAANCGVFTFPSRVCGFRRGKSYLMMSGKYRRQFVGPNSDEV